MDPKDIIKSIIPDIKAQIAETLNVSKSGHQITINTINVTFHNISIPINLPKDADLTEIARTNITQAAEQAIIKGTSGDLSKIGVTIPRNPRLEDLQIIANATAANMVTIIGSGSDKKAKK